MYYGVITEVDSGVGNLASVMDLYVPSGKKDQYGLEAYAPLAQVQPQVALGILTEWRRPVFVLGEILILDSTGREVAGHGRKPEKWSVMCETYDTLEDAVARALQVRTW